MNTLHLPIQHRFPVPWHTKENKYPHNWNIVPGSSQSQEPVQTKVTNHFNNLSPHLTRRLSTLSRTFRFSVHCASASQMIDLSFLHTCDPVWHLLLTELHPSNESGRFWPRFQVFNMNQQLEATHSWIQTNSSTTFSPRDTSQPSFLLPGIIRLLMARAANQSSSSHPSKVTCKLVSWCSLWRISAATIYYLLKATSSIWCKFNSSFVWSHNNVYSSRWPSLSMLPNLVLWKHSASMLSSRSYPPTDHLFYGLAHMRGFSKFKGQPMVR